MKNCCEELNDLKRVYYTLKDDHTEALREMNEMAKKITDLTNQLAAYDALLRFAGNQLAKSE